MEKLSEFEEENSRLKQIRRDSNVAECKNTGGIKVLNAARFINKNLIKFLMLVIVIGVIVGYYFPNLGSALQPLTPVSLLVMLYPMMIGIKLEEVTKAVKQWKLLSISMIFNYVVSPLLGGALAALFLSSYPEFAVGLILTAAVPCAGMVVAWTGMAKGNIPAAIVITALSLLAGIILIPAWMTLLAGKYVAVSPLGMLKTISLVIVIPLVLGNLTRRMLLNKYGQDKFMQIKEAFPAVSALGMYTVFFISMTAEARHIINHPEYLGIIAVPLAILYILMFSIPVLYAQITGMEYGDMIALTFSVGGKNISIALALALFFFEPLTVMIIAMKPLVQVVFMAGFYRLSPYLRKKWPHKDVLSRS
ncbi:MAG: bile acid:sodium symporter [Clostridiales bacterium]|nr:bile acid:sodium symporter [Clostridiales bacterium]MCF8023004.1 bile acid:sodium symporter [Clostridiales bacterium]